MVNISVLVTILLCSFLFIRLARAEEMQDKVSSKRSRLLYCSNNRNSYKKAREIFDVIGDAGIKLNYLGGKDEQNKIGI